MTVVAYAAGWGLWILVALLALFAWHTVLVDGLVGRRLRFVPTAGAVVLTWLASWFVVLDQLNKLHLMWILPTVFVALDLLAPGGRDRAEEHKWSRRGRHETATGESEPVKVEQTPRATPLA